VLHGDNGSGHRTAGACWDRLCAIALILEPQCVQVQRVARRVTDLSGQADGGFRGSSASSWLTLTQTLTC
jgi:hypothetical protein